MAVWQKEDVPPVDPNYPLLPELPDLSRPPTVQTGRRNFERTVLINEYFARYVCLYMAHAPLQH